jgi:hypothetical protein
MRRGLPVPGSSLVTLPTEEHPASTVAIPSVDPRGMESPSEPKGVGMKLRGAIAVGLLAIPLVAIAPAGAASTRAEYVAQVDPMCTANLGPWQKSVAADVNTYKKWVRLNKTGTFKAWMRQTHKHARALKRHVHVHAGLTDQISAVLPAAEDAQLVASWLTYRDQYERLTQSAAKAFDAFKFKKSNKLTGRAIKRSDKEWDAASSLGLLEACK